MGPHNLCEQLLVAGDETAGLSPEVDETLEVVDEHGDQGVDHGLPGDVICQRLVGVTVDEWQFVRYQHCLAQDQGCHRYRNRRAGRDPCPLQHQDLDERNKVQEDE